jgi:hypothetical protein
LRLADVMEIAPEQKTTPKSMSYNARLSCKLAPPLAYNFLTLCFESGLEKGAWMDSAVTGERCVCVCVLCVCVCVYVYMYMNLSLPSPLFLDFFLTHTHIHTYTHTQGVDGFFTVLWFYGYHSIFGG